MAEEKGPYGRPLLPHEKAPVSATEATPTLNSEQRDELLDEGFSIKVINPEHGNYWRCPHCQNADYDGHEQSCLIRRLVERLSPTSAPAESATVAHPITEEWITGYLKANGNNPNTVGNRAIARAELTAMLSAAPAPAEARKDAERIDALESGVIQATRLRMPDGWCTTTRFGNEYRYDLTLRDAIDAADAALKEST